MPLDVTFTIPFPRRVNNDLAGARERNLAWVRRWRLVRGDEGVRRYESSQVAELAAYAYPECVADDLDLAFDVTGYFFLLDDQFDVPPGRHPDAAVAACADLITLLFRPPAPAPAKAAPLVAAFADLWQRMTAGMSEHWRARAAQNWADYLAGNLTEVADRQCGATTDTDSHLRTRRRTIGVRPSLSLAERTGHYEVPALAYHSNRLESLRAATVDNIIFVNEIVSLEKDEARGDPNLVHCLMRDRRCTRQEAIDAVRVMADQRLECFLSAQRDLPRLREGLGLTGTDHEAVHRYVDAMRWWIGGNHDWSVANGRYSPLAVERVAHEQTGLLLTEDVVTPPDPPEGRSPGAGRNDGATAASRLTWGLRGG